MDNLIVANDTYGHLNIFELTATDYSTYLNNTKKVFNAIPHKMVFLVETFKDNLFIVDTYNLLAQYSLSTKKLLKKYGKIYPHGRLE